MRKIDLEKKSREIQRLISRYTKESFVCFFADFIRHNPERSKDGFSHKLKSKLKDSLYLIMLRLSSEEEGVENLTYTKENDVILQKVADILLEIVSFYLSENYVDDYFNIENDRQKLLIHEMAFKDYFQNGVLSYREQEVNKVIRLFRPYQDKIEERLNISLKTLIELCNHSEIFYREKSIKSKSFILDKGFDKLARESANGMLESEEFNEKLFQLSEHTQTSFLNFFEKPHDCLIFTKKDYYYFFEKKEVDIYCDLFSIDIEGVYNNLFYSHPNPLEEKPIIKINNNEYLNIYQKQLPTALYNLLYRTLTQTNKEKEQLNHRRGKVVLENHVLEVFKNFFKASRHLKIFKNYYINDNVEEKDILIVENRVAYIIECKSSRYREPRRNTKQAFQRIKSDFEECIQKGYEQCFQVEQEILSNDEIIIKCENIKEVMSTSEINEIFSIVVTSERFASIQADLGLLLKKNNKDVYPWSVSVDDLEVFISSLKIEFNNPIRKFSEFLEYRELLNERLVATDELDVCAMYLKNQRTFKELCESEDIIFTDPLLQGYFDKLYFSKKLKLKTLNL
ncbi:MAG: hypothetical protein ACK5M1_01775 [Xanthomarina gelatinilytica]|uniref:hypothetical protein n=1 Tax=Xanthomarina gelatinilytica TaxID=1137281 RepID=UPI003A87EBE9